MQCASVFNWYRMGKCVFITDAKSAAKKKHSVYLLINNCK